MWAIFTVDGSNSTYVGWYIQYAAGRFVFYLRGGRSALRGVRSQRAGRDVLALEGTNSEFTGELREAAVEGA